MIIAVDFDGTIVEHKFPEIGKPVPLALEVLKTLNDLGHKLILYTMRSGDYLDEAVEYLKKNDIVLYGINENPNQKTWTTSPKAYANIYIDDAGLGCPLRDSTEVDRPMVHWYKIVLDDKILLDKNTKNKLLKELDDKLFEAMIKLKKMVKDKK